MAYAQIQTSVLSHWKLLTISDRAFRLWVTGLCYAQEHLTDGWIPAGLPMLHVDGAPQAVEELLKVRLWEPHAEGFQVHDYLDWNKGKEQVLHRRSYWREHKQKSKTMHSMDSTVESTVASTVDATVDTPHSTVEAHVLPRYDPIRSDTLRSDPPVQRAREEPEPQERAVREDPTPQFWSLWRSRFREILHAEEHLTLPPAKWPELRRVANSAPLEELDAAVQLFLASPKWDTTGRHFGMFASNLPNLLSWHRLHPGVPYGVSESGKKPPPDFSATREDWTCPHEPHCGSYWGCQKRIELEQAKAREAS